MPTPIRFKGIVGTTAQIATDRFAGRIAFDSTLNRFVVFYDATNYATMARRDVLETFAAGVQDSTLTAGQVMLAGTSGRHSGDAGLTYTSSGGQLLSVGDGTSSTARLIINGAASQTKGIRLQTAGITRALLGVDTSDQTVIQSLDAAGVAIDVPVTIPNTAAAAIAFTRTLNTTGNIQTSGVTRISSGGAGSLTTLSTTGLATLAQATVSDLTTGRMVSTTTAGRLQSLDAASSRSLIGAYGSGDNVSFGTLSTTGLATLAQATVSDIAADQVVSSTTAGRLQGDAGFTLARTSNITRRLTLGNGTVAGFVGLLLRRSSGQDAGLHFREDVASVDNQRYGITHLSGGNLVVSTFTSASVLIDYPLEFTNASAGVITLGGSTLRPTNFTGAIQTTGVQRISAAGAASFTTLSTTGLATLAQATVSDLTTGRMVSTTTAGRLQTLTNSASLALIGAADNEAIEDANMMTGFSDPAGVVQSYNSGTRVVTITHASGTVEYWFKGRKYTQASPWTLPAHTATVGNWFYSSADGTTFSWSTTPWEFESVLVSYVRYGTYLKFALRECHGMMDPMVHRSAHNNIGTYLGSGGTLTAATYTVQPATPADADNTPGVDLTTLYDEDLLTSLPALPQGTYAVCWPVGSELNVQSLSVPFRVTAAGYINWFDAGVETQAANNRFLNVYAVAMPVTSDATSQSYRWIWIAPQASYSTAVDAAAETFSEINAGDISAGITEYLPRFKITYATGAAYTSTGKCRIHAIETLDRSKVNATTTTTPVALTLDGLTDVDTTGQATGDFLSLESDGIWRTQTATEVRALIGSTFANLFTGRRTVTGLTNGVTGTLIPTYTFAANTWATGEESVVRFSLFSTRDGQVEMKLGGNTVSSINLPSTVRCVIELILTCQSAGASARFAYATRISYPSTSGTPIDEVIFGDSQASADGIGDGWTVDSTASMDLTFNYTPSTGSGNPVLHAGTIRISTP